jgi:two-component system, LytTR family, sensor kinase
VVTVTSVRDQPLRTLSFAVAAIGVVSGIITSQTMAADGAGWYVLLKNSAYWSAWALLIPLAVAMAMGIRQRRWPWPVALGAHGAAAALCAGLHLAAISGLDYFLRSVLFPDPVTWAQVFRSLGFSLRFTLEWEVTMYGALAAFAYATSLQADVRKHEVAEAQLSTSLAEARLQALQRQLQPHFLFNTMHAVSALIRRDPDTAEAMIERLARLLRTSLRSGTATEVTVAEDLAALKDYLAIEEVQMRERLQVSFALEDEVMGAAVPALLLQPLVENSVRHGLQPRGRGGAIHVSVKRASEDLCLEVLDDGVGLQPNASGGAGVGLANTRSRLAQLYGSRQSFSLAGVETGGVHVRITLPFRTL